MVDTWRYDIGRWTDGGHMEDDIVRWRDGRYMEDDMVRWRDSRHMEEQHSQVDRWQTHGGTT